MNKEILRLAVPNILSNISVPLITSFDTILMGSLGGGYIAAVGLGGMAFNFVYWNFGFLRMSTTGLTARAYGAEDKAAQMATLARGNFGTIGFTSIPLRGTNALALEFTGRTGRADRRLFLHPHSGGTSGFITNGAVRLVLRAAECHFPVGIDTDR